MKARLTKLSENQKKYITFALAFLIMLAMFLVALFSSKGAFGLPGDSGTVDEVAHIPSGYSYVEYADFRLNPEHPPLAKVIAGVPLALQSNIKGPKDDWSWNGINQWEAGWYMIYEAGNDPAEVLFWARLPMILLTIGLGLFIFKWARELFGRKVALFTLLLFAFYPDIIAHGRLVTTDIAAAFGFVVATYYFSKALEKKTWKWIIIAAAAFALAQLLKFSAFLLFIVFLILIVIKAIQERDEHNFWSGLWIYFKKYFWVCAISLIFVWLVYIPFTWNTPTDIEHRLIETNLTSDPKTQFLRDFLHNFEGNKITRALGHYLLGIMLVVARVAGGNATYIMGHLSDKSISWFFPVAWLLKTPITIIILFITSVIAFIARKKTKSGAWIGSLFLVPLIVYWAFTLKGSLNIGIRHLIPTIPFVLLMIAYLVYPVFNSGKKYLTQKILLAVLALFLIVSTMSYYPGFIGYFNETVPRDQRHNYLVDSSLDWGQDLLRLKKYTEENNIKSIKLDYFGGSVPSYYMPQAVDWHSSYGPTTGWLAISATFYQSSKLYGEKEGKWSYGWLDEIKPTSIIGGSILVFNITSQDLKDHPPTSPYTIKQIDRPKTPVQRKVGL